jgi:hypothetical protein
MPINPNFVAAAYGLTALAYKEGIDCPPLVAFNAWIMGQIASPLAAMPAANASEFNAALAAALQSSPAGITTSDLRTILTRFGKSASEIGLAVGRLARKGTVQKKDHLWFWIGAPATGNGNVDRTLPPRRGRKAASVQQPAQQAATG